MVIRKYLLKQKYTDVSISPFKTVIQDHSIKSGVAESENELFMVGETRPGPGCVTTGSCLPAQGHGSADMCAAPVLRGQPTSHKTVSGSATESNLATAVSLAFPANPRPTCQTLCSPP